VTACALHPEIAARAAGAPNIELDDATLRMFRTAFANVPPELKPPLSDTVERVDHVVSEEPRVVVRVHTPRDLRMPAACVYSIHGGGYVIGSYEMDDSLLDGWCNALGCVGVSVEYRLAPDTPYPGALDDCYAGLEWTVAHARELGIDPARVGIAGVSAGGGLAAALALLARDRGGPAIAFQLLQCPMLDDRQTSVSSRAGDLIVWTRESNSFGWRSYLGERYGRDDVPAYAAPARADDLAGLPPAMVIAGGADGFRDEDVDYATRLNQAGVPTELHVYPGACHGFNLLAPDAAVSKQSAHNIERWLAAQLETRGGSSTAT
jgi:acetyl esterase/lipase